MSEEIRVGWLGGYPTTSIDLTMSPEEVIDRVSRGTSRSILAGGPLFPDRAFIGSIKGHTFKVRSVARSREMVPTLRGSVEATQAGSRLTFRVRPPLLFLPLMLMVTGVGAAVGWAGWTSGSWLTSLSGAVGTGLVWWWLAFLRRRSRQLVAWVRELVADGLVEQSPRPLREGST